MSSLPPVNPFNGPVGWDDATDSYRERHREGDAEDGYEVHEPAYRFGHESALDERYRDDDWAAAEPSLRTSWEERHPDNAWERFKASIQHAWERVRS